MKRLLLAPLLIATACLCRLVPGADPGTDRVGGHLGHRRRQERLATGAAHRRFDHQGIFRWMSKSTWRARRTAPG